MFLNAQQERQPANHTSKQILLNLALIFLVGVLLLLKDIQI